MGDETWRIDDRPKCERCDEVEEKARHHLSELTVGLNLQANRWVAIARAANALLDAIGPDMAGLEGAPPAVVEAATALQLACVGAR